jgi:hypothetical protein
VNHCQETGLARRRWPHPPSRIDEKRQLRPSLVLEAAFSARAAIPLVAIPFATSIVLVMGSPEVEAAQPRAGLAIAGMHLTRTFHPPAGIDPLLVVVNNMPWSFLLIPVAAGAALLALLRSPGTSSSAAIRGQAGGGERALCCSPLSGEGMDASPNPSGVPPIAAISLRCRELAVGANC